MVKPDKLAESDNEELCLLPISLNSLDFLLQSVGNYGKYNQVGHMIIFIFIDFFFLHVRHYPMAVWILYWKVLFPKGREKHTYTHEIFHTHAIGEINRNPRF